jgi:hypothetical protein
MNSVTGADEGIRFVHRGQAFERCLEDLRNKGGMASEAAAKAAEFIAAVLTGRGDGGREKFRFTRRGEYRIRNCRKIDLSRGYRLVCYLKDGHLVLLYAGTHDDCFRWIERNSGVQIEVHGPAHALAVRRDDEAAYAVIPDRSAEDRFAASYEEALMSRLDDAVLRKVFAGIVNGRA